jgi:hypothetical protein
VYELYKSIVDCLDGFLHHIVTTAPDLQDREGRPVPAVCLIDGFAKTDDGDSEYKAHREKAFPQALLDKSQAFSLDKAQASEPADLRSIIEDVGDHKRSLEATMRVRFSIQMLQLGPSSMQDDKYALILLDLRDSQLRNLSLTYNLSLTWDRTQTESRALQLCEALPQSLVDLRIEDGHAALAIGMAESRPLRYGRMLTLKLESCAVDDAQLRILASAFAQSHTLQLRMLNFGCALATACPRCCARDSLGLSIRMSHARCFRCCSLVSAFRSASSVASRSTPTCSRSTPTCSRSTPCAPLELLGTIA